MDTLCSSSSLESRKYTPEEEEAEWAFVNEILTIIVSPKMGPGEGCQGELQNKERAFQWLDVEHSRLVAITPSSPAC